MPEFDLGALSAFADALEKAGKEFPKMRRALHEELAEAALKEVQGVMGDGKVASWQENYVGTGGGYAKVRPKAKTWQRRYAVGAITNAIEHGHVIRKPKGSKEKYRARIRRHFVPGKGYYAHARTKAERIAVSAANKLMEELAEKMR